MKTTYNDNWRHRQSVLTTAQHSTILSIYASSERVARVTDIKVVMMAILMMMMVVVVKQLSHLTIELQTAKCIVRYEDR